MKTWQEVSDKDEESKENEKKSVSEYKEERIFEYATPIVSFLRLGQLSVSKSLCINKTLFDKNF